MRSMRSVLPLSVVTLTVLNRVPLLPARFTFTRIVLFVPGGSIHGTGGSSAVVQPQEGCTLRIVTGIGVELVTLVKLVLVVMPLVMVLYLRPVRTCQNPLFVVVVKLVIYETLVSSPTFISDATLVKAKTNRAKSIPLVTSAVFCIPSQAMTPAGSGSF